MLMRDEEYTLKRCLDSVKDIADEICIIDTGSEDSSIDIALKYGARVYNSEWMDDFSHHRNESFAKAKYDWIIRIDPDEELFLDCTVDEFRSILLDIPKDCDAARCRMLDIKNGKVKMKTMQLHFFRKDKILWQFPKHNMPIFDGKVYHLDCCYTKHYGYDLSASEMAKKRERDLRILSKWRLEDPDNSILNFYLGQILGANAETERVGFNYSMEYYKQMKDSNKMNLSVYTSIINYYIKHNQLISAKDFVNKALDADPYQLDFHFLKAKVGQLTDDIEYMLEGIDGYLMVWNNKIEDGSDLNSTYQFTYYDSPNALAWISERAALHHFSAAQDNLARFQWALKDIEDDNAKKMLLNHFKSSMEYIKLNVIYEGERHETGS
jgi:glycosyltransferase involved in cell wall biosynthesis